MWILLAVVLAGIWLLGLTVWKVASFAIHALIIAAVIAVIAHFMRRHVGGRRPIT